MSRHPNKKLVKDYCGRIRLKDLLKPVPVGGSASGVAHLIHHGQSIPVTFAVYRTTVKKGDVVFGYSVNNSGLTERYDIDFRYRRAGTAFDMFLCTCKRGTASLYFGKSFDLRCYRCHNLDTLRHQRNLKHDEQAIRDPKKIRRLIRTAYTPSQKIRALRAYLKYIELLDRLVRRKKAWTLQKDYFHSA